MPAYYLEEAILLLDISFLYNLQDTFISLPADNDLLIVDDKGHYAADTQAVGLIALFMPILLIGPFVDF
ncbi:MAG: hypothetical protein DRI97_09050 [Bacteroidetes bacterium]|nr:MAG: hypothetical protein DRI97_09050 [Bacteroidota bacterium]